MLKESNLFGPVDKVQIAIERIQTFEKSALAFNKDGYWVAFSGGKDSIVILDLVRRAGVRHVVHNSITTVDPPELVYFIKEHYPEVVRDHPEITMWKLIENKRFPPTRMVKYCCHYLKENAGGDHWVITGVRWEESNRRSSRKMVETCFRSAHKRYLNVIIDWTEEEVWEYIRKNKLPYCSLYDEGFKRIGCIGCPISTHAIRTKELERWPNFKKSYLSAMKKMVDKNKKDFKEGTFKPTGGEGSIVLTDANTMFEWWMSGDKNHSKRNSDQTIVFE